LRPLDLSDPGTLKRFLGGHGIKADKSLGQHFLCSQAVVQAIVDEVHGCAGVLEIGPGPGVLTGPLSRSVERTIAIELDPKMGALLAESAPSADVRAVDALKANLGATLDELPEPRAVVSNLPYYITGPLLTRIAEVRAHFQVAVLMMQKEVAQRVTARAPDSDRGSLSVFLQAQFEIGLVRQVPAGAFLPPPKVDSTVLRFRPREVEYPPEFFRMIRVGFAQPRKTLANNLVAGYRVEREVAISWLTEVGIEERVRPAVLEVDQWARLAGVVST
jgi:16S rRNA (adenine1518-N6/adenine1519-N6)-dimethyltransferase